MKCRMLKSNRKAWEHELKTTLLPVYFPEINEREQREYEIQKERMQKLYGEDTVFLPAVPIGEACTAKADMIVFFQLVGAVFRHRESLEKINIPVLILTSEFGTVEMWDWEIVAWLREEISMCVCAPYSQEMARVALRAQGSRKLLMGGAKFLLFQDDPGEGMQANIFKRFYWWEGECKEVIEKTFGLKIVYRSWKAVNERAKKISDAEAKSLWEQRREPSRLLGQEAILKAVKLYLALRAEAELEGQVVGIGSNCLNESFHSDTTPCLAWNWMFEYDHIIWACEGDLVSLISEYIFYQALRRPLMMTNIYPFLVEMAALKHEKIQQFPQIEDSDNHALGVHCGYFGFAPKSFCESWVLRPKVLEIVNENAVAVDCRMACGPVTMAKLHTDMKTLTIIEAEIEDYVQYPGSDCRNGALLRYTNQSGEKVMEELSSHHAILIQGKATAQLLEVAKIYGFNVKVI